MLLGEAKTKYFKRFGKTIKKYAPKNIFQNFFGNIFFLKKGSNMAGRVSAANCQEISVFWLRKQPNKS